MSEDAWNTIEKLLEEERRSKEQSRRGGPRSRLVDAIMVMLLARPMRSSEIAGILGYEVKYISSYLSYWKTRGYVEYESGFWYLTPLGESYAREVIERETDKRINEFIAIAQTLIKNRHVISRTRKDKEGGDKTGDHGDPLSFTVKDTNLAHKKRQGKVEGLWLDCAVDVISGEISGEELEVIEKLLEHYARWGITYVYLDQLQESLKADFSWLVRVLRSLQTKGFIYLYNDPRLGLRVGLSKKVKEIIAGCSEGPL